MGLDGKFSDTARVLNQRLRKIDASSNLSSEKQASLTSAKQVLNQNLNRLLKETETIPGIEMGLVHTRKFSRELGEIFSNSELSSEEVNTQVGLLTKRYNEEINTMITDSKEAMRLIVSNTDKTKQVGVEFYKKKLDDPNNKFYKWKQPI